MRTLQTKGLKTNRSDIPQLNATHKCRALATKAQHRSVHERVEVEIAGRAAVVSCPGIDFGHPLETAEAAQLLCQLVVMELQSLQMQSSN